MLEPFIQILDTLLVLGFGLTTLVIMLVNTIRKYVELPGEWPRIIAVILGTAFGALVLFFYPEVPPVEGVLDYVIRTVAAFVWAFTAPEFYDLATRVAERGHKKFVEKTESAHVMGDRAKG